MRERFPQFNTDGIEVMLLEPGAEWSRRDGPCARWSADLEQRGVSMVAGASRGSRVERPCERCARQDGAEVAGDRFVFACGAWLPGLFPGVLRSRIRPTRQVVAYFGTPAGDQRYHALAHAGMD